jgi:predicted nucleic acid-binding protein
VIVVDTNIIVYLFLANPRSILAERAYQADPLWAAPILWRSEFRNVLFGYIRKGYLILEDAQHIMQQAILAVESREYTVNSGEVLNLATQSSCSAYVCEFVALAQDLEVPLLTSDAQILKDFPGTAISLERFVSQF